MKKKNSIITDYSQKIIAFLFHLMILVVPFFFTWVNEELFEFNKMILVYGFATLITATWIIRMLINKKVLFKRTYLDIPLGLFLLSQILATIFSIHPRTSLFGYYTRFHGGLLSTFSYIALYYSFVNNFDKKQLKYFLLTIFISAIGVSSYAIPEHFGHSPSCMMISGSFDVDCWQQKVQDRIFGTFGQPNWLAAYAVMLIPLGISLFISNKFSQAKKSVNKHLASISAIAVVMLLAVVTFTQSRSGFLGLGVGLLVYVIGLILLYRKDFKRKQTLFPLKKIVIIAIPLLLIISYFGTPYTPSIKKLFSKSDQQIEQPTNQPVANRLDLGGTDSGEIRWIVWEGAFKVWKRYPLFGSGVETFAYSYYTDRPMRHNLVSEWDFLYNKAHNELLNFLATTGIFGLAAYLSMFGLFGYKALVYFLKKDEKHKEASNKIVILGLVSGLLALSISNFLGFSTVMVSVLMFIFFAFFEVITRAETTQTKNIKINLEFWDYTWIVSVILIAIFLLSQIFNIWNADYIFTKGKRLVDAGYISEGGPFLQKAIELRPNEDLFYDKFSTTLGQAALIFAQQEKLPEAQSAAQSAIMMSNTANELNSVHLNLYKTRIRLFMNLGLLDQQLLVQAKKTTQEALELAPTDAKLVFNLALIQEALGDSDSSFNNFVRATEMKANYGTALNHLAEVYLKDNQPNLALEQYKQILTYFPDDKVISDKVATLEGRLGF
ncbi:MAG: O-antigen ligase family protein [Candidatus Pacebacteria bacterium]|nr:O-antigen ligase family protein [Candidatus Paceibacterota bacterium]